MYCEFTSSLPFKIVFSFKNLIDQLSDLEYFKDDNFAKYLKDIEQYPAIFNGISSKQEFDELLPVLKPILGVIFPEVLSNNEIKALTFPFSDSYFYASKRLIKLLTNSDQDFLFDPFEANDDELYVMGCVLILKEHFHLNLDFTKPLVIKIFNKEKRFLEYFNMVYNGDFFKIHPTENSIFPNPEELHYLLNHTDDIALWKKFFKPESWILEGFGIVNLINSTTEHALTNIKDIMILQPKNKDIINEEIKLAFQSLFQSDNISIGISVLNFKKKNLDGGLVEGPFKSHFHNYKDEFLLDKISLAILKDELVKNTYLVFSDISKLPPKIEDSILVKKIESVGGKSALLVRVLEDQDDIYMIEFVSSIPGFFNAINQWYLDPLLTYLGATLERNIAMYKNEVDAVIQHQYTSIHSSVAWKFKKEAEKYLVSYTPDYKFPDILFKNLFPFYGEIDIKNSSFIQNECIKQDLAFQLQMIKSILEKPIFSTFDEVEVYVNEIVDVLEDLLMVFNSDTEYQIQKFIDNKIHPFFSKLLENEKNQLIIDYIQHLDPTSGQYNFNRKKYENTVKEINQNLAAYIDEQQVLIQGKISHYFERYNTDGLDFSIYAGKSIMEDGKFKKEYLYDLRLWHLQCVIFMNFKHQEIIDQLEIPMQLRSLILIYNRSVAIKFKMEEKHFDVDGAYNIRYAIVKKRIDKAHIFGTSERINKVDAITLVYTTTEERQEYLAYLEFLISKSYLMNKIEEFQVEDLQNVTGLNALRVDIDLSSFNQKVFYTFSDFKEFAKKKWGKIPF